MRKLLCVAVFLVAFCGAGFSAPEKQADSALVQALAAYRNEEWHSAVLFLRRAVSEPVSATDETWYMLIMSEMYAGEYVAASADCDRFFEQFAFSRYTPYIQYQKGRSLHFLGQHENAVLVLSDFCHQNPSHELYASALYWIAEAFFAEYNFDSARGLYERIVADYPDDGKVAAAQYRIEAIDQRGREEKLLYLLKVTGEENLATREDYERQLRRYEAEDRIGLRQQLSAAEARITELERELASTETRGEASVPAAENPSALSAAGVHDVQEIQPETLASSAASAVAPVTAGDPDVLALKRKAKQLQYLLDEQKNMEATE